MPVSAEERSSSSTRLTSSLWGLRVNARTYSGGGLEYWKHSTIISFFTSPFLLWLSLSLYFSAFKSYFAFQNTNFQWVLFWDECGYWLYLKICSYASVYLRNLKSSVQCLYFVFMTNSFWKSLLSLMWRCSPSPAPRPIKGDAHICFRVMWWELMNKLMFVTLPH